MLGTLRKISRSVLGYGATRARDVEVRQWERFTTITILVNVLVFASQIAAGWFFSILPSSVYIAEDIIVASYPGIFFSLVGIGLYLLLKFVDRYHVLCALIAVNLFDIGYLVYLYGANGGYTFFVFPLFLASILFFHRKPLLLIGVLLIEYVSIFLFVRIIAADGQIRLPADLQHVVKIFITGLTGLTVLATLVGVTISSSLRSRLYALWELASNLGVSADISYQERRIHIVFNRGIMIACIYTAIISPLMVYLVGMMAIWNNEIETINAIALPYLFVAVVGILLSVSIIWLRKKRPSQFIKNINYVVAYLAVVLVSYIFCYSIMLSPAVPMKVFLLPLAMFIIIMYPLLYRGVFVSLQILCLLAYYAISEFHITHGALWPIPAFGEPFLVNGIIGLLVAIVFFIVFYLQHESGKSEYRLEEARQTIRQQYNESEKLLRNILPAEVAEELKQKGHSEPTHFESVTVFFTDFVGFTKIAEDLTPGELVDELDRCFSYFDQVTEKYELEKLKTIGDAFMAAGGIPVPNKTHAIDVCLAAMEIQAFMNQMKQLKDSQGLPYWELRLGINTGSLVAGVVGEKKFAYDVWGDTVNTASRIESNGVSGRINISKPTYERVEPFFDCEYRGQLEAKNKGPVDMYFLNGIRAEFSVGGDQRTPNEKFHEALAARALGETERAEALLNRS